jgi:serine/threonine-protein kinase
MTERIGSRIGTFEIAEPLGAGGMGEVYRARDTRLGREVAIKILPPSFAVDADRRARFEREARVLASLNHPHIATLYGIEESPAGPVLVMELVDGDTLADRLALSGRRAVREVLTIAKQVAAALEAAHEQGIIHRDLKPANIKITRDRRVKVLDFGIAKAVAAPHDETQTIEGATQAGVIVGTPAYMSPEQARGETVGVQSDIWSFGAVLYEMLTGVSPFKRKTGAETVARVLESQPDYGALPAGMPALARRLVQRCLERDPSARLQHMGDVRILVEEALASLDSPAATESTSIGRRRALWIGTGLVAAVLAGMAIGMLANRSTPTRTTTPLYVSVPFEGRPVQYSFGTRQIAISPDGSTVAFASNRGVQIRHIDKREGAIISTGGKNPFFSPDGDWVGLFNDTAMVKVPVRGGTPVSITGLTDRPFGASWRADGTIVFATTEGLFEVSANGGEPRAIVRPDRGRGETLYAWPHFLPDGGSILYTAVSKDAKDGPQTILLDLKSHARKALVQGSSAVYAAGGHLVYSAGSTLNTIAFDAATGVLTGKPVAIPGIEVATSTDNFAANFAISDTGTLVVLPPTAADRGTFEWIDRHGQREPLDIEPQRYEYAMVSPDGTRVALERYTNGIRNIWILDLKRLTQTQLTDGPIEDNLPVWSADGQRVFFASNRSGNFDVYSQAADGASSATLVFAAPGFQAPSATTPDGTRLLIYDRFDDLAILNLAKPDHLEPLLHSSFDERLGQISRDGRWIAYESNESGNQFEIVLRSFPDVTARREIISINGGRYPRWGPKGLDELYYLSADGAIMAVPIRLSPALAVGTPKKLFDWQKPPQTRSGLRYDVAPDGRFLMPKAQAPSPDVPTNVSLTVNWLADLRTRQP